MLKGKLIHPQLMAALSACGHGDKILIADGNYPLESKTTDAELVYLGLTPGLPTVTDVLEAILSAANAPDSLRALREKYPRLFLLVDGYGAVGANAKNCAWAFDKLGHGAIVCGGGSILRAWQQAESDGSDYVSQAETAVERMKRNLSRYITIL